MRGQPGFENFEPTSAEVTSHQQQKYTVMFFFVKIIKVFLQTFREEKIVLRLFGKAEALGLACISFKGYQLRFIIIFACTGDVLLGNRSLLWGLFNF